MTYSATPRLASYSASKSRCIITKSSMKLPKSTRNQSSSCTPTKTKKESTSANPTSSLSIGSPNSPMTKNSCTSNYKMYICVVLSFSSLFPREGNRSKVTRCSLSTLLQRAALLSASNYSNPKRKAMKWLILRTCLFCGLNKAI